jgi:eukaryotic-like serine/threonine-protein kinase
MLAMVFQDRRPATQRLGEQVNDRWQLLDLMEVDVGFYEYEVFAAELPSRQEPEGHKTVLRALRPELCDDSVIVACLERAQSSLSGLANPDLALPLDQATTTDGLPYVVTAFPGEERLSDYLSRRRARVAPAEALRIVAQLLDFLAIAHAEQIPHGDVEPRFIWLGPLGEVTLTGFGWWKVRDLAAQHFGLACAPGAAGYMAPEQAHSRTATPGSDIWSVGAILFELLSGEPLRPRKGDEELLAEASLKRPRALRDANITAPKRLTALLEKALAWEPCQRFTSASEFAAACRNVAESPELVNLPSLADASHAATMPSMPAPSSGPRPTTRTQVPRTSHVGPRPDLPGSNRPPGEARASSDVDAGRYSTGGAQERVYTPTPRSKR